MKTVMMTMTTTMATITMEHDHNDYVDHNNNTISSIDPGGRKDFLLHANF